MAVSKRTRFEVFKRDNFACQYCGAKAPDVVLNVDHVHPKAGGGVDDLLNLVTSCFPCNSGKSDRPLSDKSAVTKQRDQLDQLEERRAQLDMMIEWQRELSALDRDGVDQLCEMWNDLIVGNRLNSSGRDTVRKTVAKFGAEQVAVAMRTAAMKYLEFNAEGVATSESCSAALHFVRRICIVNESAKTDPFAKEVAYICGTIRNRLNYFDLGVVADRTGHALDLGASFEKVKRLAQTTPSYTKFLRVLQTFIDAQKEA